MVIYTVWLDRQGKWHAFEDGTTALGGRKYGRELSRQSARLLTGQKYGTSDLFNTALVAFCVEASNRYWALKTARMNYEPG